MNSKKKAILLGAASMAFLAGAAPALAQDVVFVRPILSTQSGEYSWTTSPYRAVDGSGNTLNEASLCGTYAVARTAQCVNSSGSPVDSSFCSSVAKPATSSTQSFSGGCTYSWNTGSWVDPGASCTSSETQTRPVSCRVDQTGATTADSNCSGAKPATAQTVSDYSACTYSWQTGGWADPGASCTGSETQTRSVTCQRSDGTTVADGNCSGGKPAASQTVADYSGCSYDWQAGSWGSWSDSCSSSATRNRAVWCYRSDGQNMDAIESSSTSHARCSSDPTASPEPAASQTGANYAGCTYSWVTSGWGAWNSTCSGSATRSRSVSCLRSDGTTVANSNCTSAQPATSDTAAVYTGCSYDWQVGSWGSWSSTCSSSATRNRAVWCFRSDGQNMDAIEPASTAHQRCIDDPSASAQPNGGETAAVYSGCSYTWETGSWNDPGASCTSSELQSRSVICRRGDGASVSASYCSGAAPSASRTVADYSACSYTWETGSWNDPGASCTDAELQSRSVICRRSDGASVSASYCSGSAPSASRTVADYSACSTQTSVQWSGWTYASTCSANTTRSRTGTCIIDGSAVDPKYCETYGGKPLSETQSTANYSGCSYNWVAGSWGSWSSTCSSSATRNRPVWCYRSDGQNMDAIEPASTAHNRCATDPTAGPKPSGSESGAVWSGCTYNWQTTPWSNWEGCNGPGDTSDRSRSVSCQRQETGATVSNSYCSGGTPASSESLACTGSPCDLNVVRSTYGPRSWVHGPSYDDPQSENADHKSDCWSRNGVCLVLAQTDQTTGTDAYGDLVVVTEWTEICYRPDNSGNFQNVGAWSYQFQD